MKLLRLNLDALGVFASTLCMIHCLAFPLLLAVLPMMQLTAAEPSNGDKGRSAVVEASGAAAPHPEHCCPEHGCHSSAEACDGAAAASGPACCSTPTDYWIHVGMLATIAPLGLIAWGAGFRQHRRWGVIGLGLAGVSLLGGAILFGQQLLGGYGEPVMTVIGSICMVSAHLWNRHQCRCCRNPDLAHVVELDPVPMARPQTG